MKRGIETNTEGFAHAKRQLYILSGSEPQRTSGTINKFNKGEHLRFTFLQVPSYQFNLVKVLLKILNIQHCSELFKNIGTLEQPVYEYYITVSKTQFNKLNSYFNSVSLKQHSIKMTTYLEPEEQAVSHDVLFGATFMKALKERNQNEYVLDSLMFYFRCLLVNSAPCFDYLKERNIETVLLDKRNIDDEPNDPEETLFDDEPSPITHLRTSKDHRGNTTLVVKSEELNKTKRNAL